MGFLKKVKDYVVEEIKKDFKEESKRETSVSNGFIGCGHIAGIILLMTVAFIFLMNGSERYEINSQDEIVEQELIVKSQKIVDSHAEIDSSLKNTYTFKDIKGDVTVEYAFGKEGSDDILFTYREKVAIKDLKNHKIYDVGSKMKHDHVYKITYHSQFGNTDMFRVSDAEVAFVKDLIKENELKDGKYVKKSDVKKIEQPYTWTDTKPVKTEIDVLLNQEQSGLFNNNTIVTPIKLTIE